MACDILFTTLAIENLQKVEALVIDMVYSLMYHVYGTVRIQRVSLSFHAWIIIIQFGYFPSYYSQMNFMQLFD